MTWSRYCSAHADKRLFDLHTATLAKCATRCTATAQLRSPPCECFDYDARSGSCRGTSGVDLKDSSHGENAYTRNRI